MCAGVQNVSRPIVRCHEMSQRMPMAMLTPPARTARTKPETAAGRDSRFGTATRVSIRLQQNILLGVYTDAHGFYRMKWSIPEWREAYGVRPGLPALSTTRRARKREQAPRTPHAS